MAPYNSESFEITLSVYLKVYIWYMENPLRERLKAGPSCDRVSLSLQMTRNYKANFTISLIHVTKNGDDTGYSPPKAMYLVTMYSSIPCPPSLPIPLSLMPPKGTMAAEIVPVLVPIIPTSSFSATLHTRPISLE